MTFKEEWLKEDEKCQYCGNVTKRAKGINKQNIKRLFSPKINEREVMTLIMIFLTLLMFWAAKHDLEVCKDTANNMDYYCAEWYNYKVSLQEYNSNINWSDWVTHLNGTPYRLNSSLTEANITKNG